MRALAENEERLRLALDANKLGIFDWDMRTGRIYWNDHHANIFGLHPFEFDDRYETFQKCVHPDDLAELEREVQGSMDAGQMYRHSFRVIHRDGAIRWVLGMGRFFFEESGKPVRMVGIVRDVTEERAAEHKLRETNQFLTALIENAPALIYVAARDSRLTLVNTEWEQVVEISRDDAIGRSLHELFPPEIADQYDSANRQVRQTGLPGSFTEEVVTPHKHRYFHTVKFPLLDEAGEIASVGGISVDITDQHELENERLKLGKLEAVGRLAGGIAHDFNNLLSIILGNVSLLLRAGALPSTTTHRLSTVESACRRATSLTQQLLTFARGGDPVLVPTSLGNLIREVVEFSLHGTAIEAIFDIADNLATVNVDSGQIGQVFQNLTLNARDAMPEGGHLHVVAENVTAGTGKPSLHPGRYVRITVTDNGTGMPMKTAEHIFDPYFTTKTYGHGLGLSVVHSIIKRHNGHIRVLSALGVGTTFEIHLPVGHGASGPQHPSEEKRSFNLAGLSVLVLEDDEDVRDFMEAALNQLGCRTTLTGTGDQTIRAIEESRQGQHPFTLVFLDATVRGSQGGRELLHLLRDRIPDLRAVLCSGYATGGGLADYRELGFQALLSKPFTLKDLETAILSALMGQVDFRP